MQQRLEAWTRDGFFVARHCFDAQHVGRLADACDHALQQVRASCRDTGHTSTHITGLLLPEYYHDRPDALQELVRLPSAREVLAMIHDLGRPLEGELQLRATHYFHEPSDRDYDGPWHRDGDEGTQLGAADDGQAARRSTLLRFRVALRADDHLEYVPGSHVRCDTQAELQLRRGATRNAALGGAVRIALEPGDVCVFDTWGIHRGRYRSARPRRTLDLVYGFGARRSSGFDALAYLKRRALGR